MFTTLSGLKIAVPAKAGEPEYIWRHWSHAQENRETFDHAQGLGATPLQNLEAILEDFQYFCYPYGPIETIPNQFEGNCDWRDCTTWKRVGASSWVMKVKTNTGYYHFTFSEARKTLRMETSEDSEFKGRTTVKWFNL